MTVREIHKAVSAVKPISRPQLYNYFEALKIAPIGARQRPQQFPDNTANRILVHLGHLPPLKERFKADSGRVTTIPTMRELRAARGKARAGK